MKAGRLLLALTALSIVLTGCGPTQNASIPLCLGQGGSDSVLVLMAQSVPSAAYVPCIKSFPAGWTFGGERIRDGRSEFWLDSDRAGLGALHVFLDRTCDISTAVEIPLEAGEPPMERYEKPKVLPPTFTGDRYYVFPGGCITYRFSFLPGATFAQVVEANEALSFVDRSVGVRELAKFGLVLCGRGVHCPG